MRRLRIMITKIDYKAYKLNKYKPALAVLFLICIWYILIGRDLLHTLTERPQAELTQKVYYAYPCSEANLVRLLGITLGKGEVSTEEESLWYEKYYESIEDMGITCLKKEEAFNIVSSQKLEKVLGQVIGSSISIASKEQMMLYEVIGYCDEFLKEQAPIQYESLVVLATPTDKQELFAWEALTNKGIYNFEGIVLDPLKNQNIQIAYKGNKILGVCELKGENFSLQDCKIVEVREKKVKIEIQGHLLEYENQGVTSEALNQIGSVVLEKGKILSFQQQMLETDTILSVSEGEIELEKAGKLRFDQIKVEDQTGSNHYQELTDLCYGLKVAYTKSGDKVSRIEVVGESTLKEIRVVLHSENQNYLQQEVKLKSQQDYDKVIDGKATTFEAGQEWSAQEYDWQENNRIRFVPREEKSKMQVLSLLRNEAIPSYSGIIEVIKYKEGYGIINEVDLEDYVAGVLPSEMPTSYGKEALKAQAIAIRTYGVAAKNSTSFLAYSAHVDDTIATQVYNRLPSNDNALSAVKETRGLVLKSDGKLIQNKFFATSCGYTANSGEVWASDHFPGQSLDYLVSRQQYIGDQLEAPKDEEAFKKFIALTADDLDAFDEASPWFRWRVELSGEALKRLLVPSIQKLVDEKNIWIECKLSGNSNMNHESIEQLGEMKEMKVLERGEGGNVMRLEITFDKGSITAHTEYVIRKLFSSNENQGLTVIRSDGTKVHELNLLPSAFFTIEAEKDQEEKIKNITLLGGGNGHGVGLSQDGAKGMAQRGYRYDEILEHYYKNCEIVVGE